MVVAFIMVRGLDISLIFLQASSQCYHQVLRSLWVCSSQLVLVIICIQLLLHHMNSLSYHKHSKIKTKKQICISKKFWLYLYLYSLDRDNENDHSWVQRSRNLVCEYFLSSPLGYSLPLSDLFRIPSNLCCSYWNQCSHLPSPPPLDFDELIICSNVI